ncbi:M23 family metallopeptidase [Paenibacillus sp.]|uniref:M23 family metallopeptidase n=1 Tax=Paenibacillus sp. TaxID=58172 RepID=UPI002D48FA82|nr:M23 family metallopeptidase [Paenibacillus sp.]HZG83814.1 M23 family metallopeptidase [Paenibacillus sp.]
MPMKFRLTSPYGTLEEVRDGRVHTGIDLAMPRGTELHSVADGVVERVVDYGAENIGKGVILRLDDGTRIVYGHMDKVTVHDGERIRVGELLGFSGNTGHSTGPHLHFAMMRGGEWIDPTPMAETVDKFSGGGVGSALTAPIRGLAERALGSTVGEAKAAVRGHIQEQIVDWLAATGNLLVDAIYPITLIGCGLGIVLGVVGLKDGYRWSGILFTVYVLVRFFVRGVAA